MIWAIAVACLAAIAVYPFWRENRLDRMDAAARETAPGQFVTLTDGVTHYEWLGPARGPVAVCVHGLTTPSYVWKGLADGLAAQGYRVLIYDLFGRGYSDRPPGKQDKAFFLRQLEELLESQEVEGDLTVLGYSMGGAIATVFSAAHPGRIRQLVLLAPAGIRMPDLPLSRRAGLWPVFGDWLMRLTYPSMHRKGTEAERDLPSSVPGIVDLQQRELEYRGFTPAVLASARGLLSEPLDADHRTIAGHNIPLLAVFGEDDPLIPPSAAGPLMAWNRHAQVETIPGAGHGLTYTHTDEIMEHIARFLRDKPE